MSYALTIQRQHELEAGFILYYGTIAADSSVASGGEVIDVAGNTQFDYLDAQAPGYTFTFDPATQKLTVDRQKDPAAAGGADIALPEAAGADLSAVPIRFFAIGA